MRSSLFAATLALALAQPALAGGTAPAACISPFCGGFQDAMVDSLNDAGLVDIDGLSVNQDATGATWLTILSTDANGLDAIAPRSGASTEPVTGTVSYSRTIPITLNGVDTITLPGDGFKPMITLIGDIGPGCTKTCVCTETGEECWWECEPY